MNGNDEPEWLHPIDPLVDSYAPEQIESELEPRHAPYLREAQRLVIEGLVPDESGLEAGIRAETRRYLRSHPWFESPSPALVVAAVEAATLTSLAAIIASAAPSAAPAAAAQDRPVRRLAIQPAATMVGNMVVRKKRTGAGVELSWDGAPGVVEWTLRVSERPDPRQDYVDAEPVALPATARSCEVTLDDVPRRIQLYGRARGGRIVRRAVISALTSGNSGAQWKRQSSAS
jgi:hypothetical protein